MATLIIEEMSAAGIPCPDTSATRMPIWLLCSVPLAPFDRFLLYTDGVTETENAAGEAFGDRQLERIVRRNSLQPASELSRLVLSELQRWRPAAENQQDDITLIVVDVR
ncbi:MAG TPA: SpoIIE family protein phosphatase [Terriglobales bacterium]|nr:SpoIIE family protein phosphatase [Terriglobales bacterium]